jgi:uncharacterized protein with FMN-binding domain
MNELIKRATPGLALAGVALSTVWLFDPALHHGDTEEASATAADTAESDDADDDGADDDDAADDADGQAQAESAPDPGSTDQGSGSTQPSAPASGDCSTTESATGPAVMTEWGPVQVQVEFASDGSVCSVQAVAFPNNDPKSARINGGAIPYLDQQASQVGTAFDAVSGATYTSEAYRESLQSILDRR